MDDSAAHNSRREPYPSVNTSPFDSRTSEFYCTLIEHTPNAILTIDETDTIVFANPAVERLFGYSPTDLVGELWLELIPERLQSEYQGTFHEFLAKDEMPNQNNFEIFGEHEDGREIPLSVASHVHEQPDSKLVSVIIKDVTQSKQREQKLQRQRDELRRLDRINDVIRDVNKLLVKATSRDEIENAVCDRLTDASPYKFAWVGEVDVANQTVVPRAYAGVEDGYLEEITVTTNDEPTGNGPSGRAVREGTTQVAQNILENDDFEPWHDAARERGYRASASIPITYENTVYGVINVYACHPNAFDDREQTVLSELGEIVGHAINAIERKKALIADTVTELEFRIEELVAPLVEAADDEPELMRMERTVPADEDTYLMYVTVNGISKDCFVDVMSSLEKVENVRFISDSADRTLYELQFENPPVIEAVAAHGGQVKKGVVKDGAFHITTELPADTEIRTVVEAFKDLFPDVTLVSQGTAVREGRTLDQYQATIQDRLTDKQQAVLGAAFSGGYFERPRESTGTELAESLGITASTFHQHLQAALRKLLAAVLEETPHDT